MKINQNDLRIETYIGSKGLLSITHLPSRTVVEQLFGPDQEIKSQHKARDIAMKKMEEI